jgi:hypothetical protein
MSNLFNPSIGLLWLLRIYSSLSTEFFLKSLNHILVQLEGLDENIRINRRIGSKNIICYIDGSRILATKTGKSNSIGLSYINLEVNESNGKINKSPGFRILAKRRLSGLDVTKPANRVPSTTKKISVARG